ncbi:MAG: UDP-N-acetylmuramate--L-alanine ligase [Cellulosilyticaceae bacterium]
MIDIHLDGMNKHIYFIGIGGISMSGLSEIMHARGYRVSGSDMKHSEITKQLQAKNIDVFVPHSGSHINSDIDLVVYTAAIASDNPELVKAKELGLQVVSRSQFLGYLMNTYKYPICISGTHGKTTTTSMLSETFISSGLNPTITVGGILKSIQGNIRLGGDEYFITEACEYCDSFLNFFPKVGVILNIEEDHMDYFKDLDQIRSSFLKFGKLIAWDGFLAINGHIEHIEPLLSEMVCKVETFGLDENFDWYAKNIVFDDTACPSFDVYYKGSFMGNLKLHVAGMHNVLNALSVCAVCHFVHIDLASINLGLSLFTGANQRFEIKGKLHDITIVDDYAHHPTEIAATLSVAKAFPHNRLFVVFQPHTYTRTKAFLSDFAAVLSEADNVIITDIYAAREKNPGDIHAMDIISHMDTSDKNILYLADFSEIADYLLENCVPGDLIITMGAGNVNQIADILLGK